MIMIGFKSSTAPHQSLTVLLILIHIFGTVQFVGSLITCSKCSGKSCDSKKVETCEGDACFYSKHPLIPGGDGGVKGCIKGDHPYEIDNECIRSEPHSWKSSTDHFCICDSGDGCSDDLAKLKSTEEGDPTDFMGLEGLDCNFSDEKDEEEEEKEGCHACWSAKLSPESDEIVQGCSNSYLGFSGHYCISPAYLDAAVSVAPIDLSDESTICYCNRDSCNIKSGSALNELSTPENSALKLSVAYELPNGLKVTADEPGYVKLFPKSSSLNLESDFDFEIESPNGCIKLKGELTENGKALVLENQKAAELPKTVGGKNEKDEKEEEEEEKEKIKGGTKEENEEDEEEEKEGAEKGGEGSEHGGKVIDSVKNAEQKTKANEEKASADNTVIIIVFVVIIVVIILAGLVWKFQLKDKIKAARYQSVS